MVDTMVARHDVGIPHASLERKNVALQQRIDWMAHRERTSSRFAPACQKWPWPPFGVSATLELLAPVPVPPNASSV